MKGCAQVGLCLIAGGNPFVYQSCTAQQQPKGSMEGFFKFVEGTTKRPTGAEFNVEVTAVLHKTKELINAFM